MENDVFFRLNKNFRTVLFFLYFFCIGIFANAQNVESESDNEDETEISDEKAEEKWQVLEWEEPYPDSVLNYEVTIQEIKFDKKTKKQIFVDCRKIKTEDNESSVKITPILPSGNYRYKITTYDLIGFPAAVSEWKDFLIYKSYKPVVKGISSAITFNSTVYLEEYNDGVFNVEGRNLFNTPNEENQFNCTTYYLMSSIGLERKVLIPEILEHNKNNKNLKVAFDIEKLDVGIYNFIARDASGKTSEINSDNELVVKFKKPMDLDVSLGYPFITNVIDETLPKYLEQKAFPTSVTARVSFFPMKHIWGYLGIGISGFASRINAPVKDYVIDGNLAIGNFYMAYQKPIYRRINDTQRKHFMTFEARVGGGATIFSNMAFHFPHGIDTPPLNSTSLSATAGVSLQYYIFSRLFVEVNADFVYAFVKDMKPGFFIPSLCIGWQF